jgi:hypothetical protein
LLWSLCGTINYRLVAVVPCFSSHQHRVRPQNLVLSYEMDEIAVYWNPTN